MPISVGQMVVRLGYGGIPAADTKVILGVRAPAPVAQRAMGVASAGVIPFEVFKAS